MFSQASVILFTGGDVKDTPWADTPSPWADIPSPGQTLSPPGQTPPSPRADTPSLSRHPTPQADTPCPMHAGIQPPHPVHARIHPPPTATDADGMHPTGMHSCFSRLLYCPFTGRERLIRSHLSARFSFELSRNSN